MSVAYVCDREECKTFLKVEPGLVGVLPKGWTAVEVAEGSGAQNPMKRSYHLCSACSNAFRGSLPKVLP